MIDEEETFKLFGYYSTDFKPKSQKKVVAICKKCNRTRIVEKRSSYNLCRSCSGKEQFDDPIIYENNRKRVIEQWSDPIICDKARDSANKRWEQPEERKMASERLLDRHKDPIEHEKIIKDIKDAANKLRPCICIICGSDFEGKLNSRYCPDCSPNEYCHKFNDDCKEHNRDKYDRECFFCGKSEEENGVKLSVHHIDDNKNQGCDDTPDWKLVPLCKRCHGFTRGNKENREIWSLRILYLREEYWKNVMMVKPMINDAKKSLDTWSADAQKGIEKELRQIYKDVDIK